MSRCRLVGLAVVTVTLLASLTTAATAQAPRKEPPVQAQPCTCVVHPLGTLADDPKCVKWIVETIPDMIQPNTWTAPPSRRLSYYAPGKALVVCHTAAVQAEIKSFLADMQKATAAAQVPMTDRQVVPARFTDVRPLEPAAGTRGAYPIPTAQTPPKHLFHLILRYEGDGLDGEAVTALVNQLNGEAKDKDKAAPDGAKGSPLGQLLHFIVRYEGEGIIDSNVASLLRDIYGANAGNHPPPTLSVPVAAPSSSYGPAPTNTPGPTAPTPPAPRHAPTSGVVVQ